MRWFEPKVRLEKPSERSVKARARRRMCVNCTPVASSNSVSFCITHNKTDCVNSRIQASQDVDMTHLEQRICLDPVPVALRLLHLQRVMSQLRPRLEELRIGAKESVGEDPVSLVDSAVEEDRTHHGLEAVGHSVAKFGIVA